MEGLTVGRSKDAQYLQLLYLPSLLTLTLRPNLAQREAFSELPVPPPPPSIQMTPLFLSLFCLHLLMPTPTDAYTS